MAAHRRLLVSAWRHADRRILAGGGTAGRRLGARAGSGTLSRAGLTFSPRPSPWEVRFASHRPCLPHIWVRFVEMLNAASPLRPPAVGLFCENCRSALLLGGGFVL